MLASSGAFATTYKGAYYYEAHQLLIGGTLNGTVWNLNNMEVGATGLLKITRISAQLTGGTLSGCTTAPYAVAGTEPSPNITLTINNGVSAATASASVVMNAGELFFIGFGGGAGCSTSTGTALGLNIVVEYELEAGSNGPYTANTWWSTSNPNTGAPFLHATFDNTSSHGWAVPSGFTDLPEGGILYATAGFQGCSTAPYYTLSSGTTAGTFDYGMGVSLWVQYDPGFTSGTAAGSNVTLSNVLGGGCDPYEENYGQSVWYGTDSSDVGPFYLSSFFQLPGDPGGVSTIAIANVTSSIPVGATITSLRAAVNGGQYPTGCATWPSIGIKVGSTTQTASFSSSATDPLWTGTLSVPAGSALRFVYTSGSGCSGPIQFTAVAQYSIP